MKIQPPKSVRLNEILPSEPMLLMGAGPTPIPHAVAQANGVVINHLGASMNRIIERVRIMSQYIFQTKSDKILGVSGPASAAMEMAISNLLWPGRKVLVFKQGTFSGRFGEMAEAVGAEFKVIEPEGLLPVTKEMVEKELNESKYDVVTIAQGETSCGVMNHDLPQIAKIVKKQGALLIVDAVCTLTTMPLYMDEWNIDVVITGGQKGLSSIPGVSLIAFSEEAWKMLDKRNNICPHWCLDARRAFQFWRHGKYHYTAPVPGVLALHEALRLVCEETLEKRFERHKLSSSALQSGIEAMGLKLYIPEEYRLDSVVSIDIPGNIDPDKVRNYMSDTFHVEISGAFGLRIIRIGQMGEQCRSHNLFKVLYALGMSFQHFGINVNIAAGMAALEKDLVKDEISFVK